MQEYAVEIHGIEHTVLLSDEDAKARGLSPIARKAAPASKDKARTPKNKES